MSHLSTEYLRVQQKDTDAGPITVTRGMYDFNPDAYELLDEAAVDAGNNPLPSQAVLDQQPVPAAAYSDMKVAELKAEIERRNADRDPEGDNYLSAAGVKADLVAVLDADDSNPTPAADAAGTPGQ